MTAVAARGSPSAVPQGPIAVVMAKAPVAGAVKTRLVGSGLDSQVAAEIAFAMLRCTCARLRSIFPYLAIAVSPDEAAKGLVDRLDLPFDWVGGQGGGDLGDRIARIAREVAGSTPVAFFGMDSPDIPLSILTELCDWLSGTKDRRIDQQAAIGPTPDGGYWVLAAHSFNIAIVRDIDWGTSEVYDQTCARIRGVGLCIRELPVWDDIDEVEDLIALKSRLASQDAASSSHLSTLQKDIVRLFDM